MCAALFCVFRFVTFIMMSMRPLIVMQLQLMVIIMMIMMMVEELLQNRNNGWKLNLSYSDVVLFVALIRLLRAFKHGSISNYFHFLLVCLFADVLVCLFVCSFLDQLLACIEMEIILDYPENFNGNYRRINTIFPMIREFGLEQDLFGKTKNGKINKRTKTNTPNYYLFQLPRND